MQRETIVESVYMDSPLGLLWIAADAGGVIEIAFCDAESAPRPARDVQNPHLKACVQELGEYFAGTRQEFTVEVNMQGTEFQKQVWAQLRRIPHGETRSYSDIVSMLGRSTGSRAVGMANSKNPIAIVVPCHRVIGKKGDLVGYASGLERKKKLLDLEGVLL